MTAPHPLPAAGGSYIRNADGSLTPIDPAGIEDQADVPADPALEPTVKRGVKAPAKEG